MQIVARGHQTRQSLTERLIRLNCLAVIRMPANAGVSVAVRPACIAYAGKCISLVADLSFAIVAAVDGPLIDKFDNQVNTLT